MIDFTKLSDFSYWIDPDPSDLSNPYLYFFLTVFGLCVIVSLLLRSMGRQYVRDLHCAQQRILYRVEGMLITLGIMGLLWTFFRYELVPFFSGRFWIVVWILAFIIWAYCTFHYACYQVPVIVERDRDRQKREKYFFPKSKR